MKNVLQTLVLIIVSILTITNMNAQNAGISDDGTSFTPNSSSILELKSTSKGLLVPRMTQAQRTAISSPGEGLLVYQTDEIKGFYYYTSSIWKNVATGNYTVNPVEKSTSCTLSKTETFILATNDITISLPEITTDDNGLTITVKNVGNADDLITVNGVNTQIDDKNDNFIYRWRAKTYIAYNEEWYLQTKSAQTDYIYDVSPDGSWTTIEEIISFLNEHMEAPSVVRLSGGSFPVSSTITINLPYSLTIEGTAYGNASIEASSGLTNKPMFRCLSECYFKMLSFDGSTLINYGSNSGEDAIRFVGSGTYNEVKDCTFSTFYKSILDSTDAELWIFETDFSDISYAAIQFTGSQSGLIFKISEVDFIGCSRGIEFYNGSGVVSSVMNCGFYNSTGNDSAVIYRPSTFSFSDFYFTNNTWNYTGKFFVGYDFTRADGRDANIKIMNNSGIEDQNPKCKINVRNNTTATTVSCANTWYKANWTNTSALTTKFQIVNNKIIYQPSNTMYGFFVITGNISVSSASRIISIGIVKNGVTSTRYGECDLKPSSANVPMQFSTVIYISGVTLNDYFELYVTANASCNVTFQDVQWFTSTY